MRGNERRGGIGTAETSGAGEIAYPADVQCLNSSLELDGSSTSSIEADGITSLPKLFKGLPDAPTSEDGRGKTSVEGTGELSSSDENSELETPVGTAAAFA